MKRIIVLSLCLVLMAEVFSQVRPAGRRHYNRFFESITYVVEDRDPFSYYNIHMKEAMERHWTITPFEIISFEQFQRMRTNEEASFMVFADIQQRNQEYIYEFINFVMGDSNRNFERMPDLGSVPLSYLGASDVNYLYKMGLFVKFMQTHVQERSSPRMRISRFANVNDGEQLRQMRLWLLEDELAPDINTVEKIQKYYPYQVELVTREQIKEAIDTDRPDVAIFHKIGPEDTQAMRRGYVWKFILAVEDGRVLYSDRHEISRNEPDALLRSDLEDLAK